VDEGRKRVIGIIAGIIMARNLDVADDLFGGPQGSPRTDKMIAADLHRPSMSDIAILRQVSRGDTANSTAVNSTAVIDLHSHPA